MTTSKKTDWNLVIQGYLSIIFLQECLIDNNKNKTISELIDEFKNKNEGVSFFNVGVLIQTAYLCFLYVKESENKVDLSKIDFSKFQIKKSIESVSNEYIVRKIRNSMAHSNFKLINNNTIEIKDYYNNELNFEAYISISDFGYFVNDYMFLAKDAFFNKV